MQPSSMQLLKVPQYVLSHVWCADKYTTMPKSFLHELSPDANTLIGFYTTSSIIFKNTGGDGAGVKYCLETSPVGLGISKPDSVRYRYTHTGPSFRCTAALRAALLRCRVDCSHDASVLSLAGLPEQAA
jgi:hypothetical protein